MIHLYALALLKQLLNSTKQPIRLFIDWHVDTGNEVKHQMPLFPVIKILVLKVLSVLQKIQN